MSGKGLFVVLIVVAAVVVTLGESEQSTEVGVDPQPLPNNNTTPAPSTTKPTTPTPTTTPTTTKPTTPTTTPTTTKPTTPTTTPTTTKPTTPTTKPTTPTTKPTTPTTKPTTPTTKPTTPTTKPAPPTTTAAPTTPTTTAPPVSRPEIGKWVVQNETGNVTCIIADMAVQLNVTRKDSTNKTFVLEVPKNATASGACGPTVQVLNLTWPSANRTNELVVSFEKNDTAKDFSVSFNLTVQILDGNTTTEMKLKSVKPEFTTPYKMSYRCVKAQELNLTLEGSNATVGFLTISNTQLEAFHNQTDQTFSAAKDCEAAGSPDIVPIAVGCALVGLVAIVLIAYLIGRRRSQARGYLSIDGTDSEERR